MTSNSSEVVLFGDWPSLPEHLLLLIFSRCDAIDLLAIKEVCLQWQRIASDFSLTSHLDFISSAKPIEKNSLIELLLFVSNNLISLKISDRKMAIKDPVRGWGRGRGPTHRWINIINTQILQILRDKCHRLRRLALEDNSEKIYNSNLPSNLSHLSLFKCRNVSFVVFETFISSVDKFRSIIYLNISYSRDFESISCHILNEFKALKYLYFEGLNRINNGGIFDINPQIISQLIVIDLESTDIKDESFEYILNNGHSLEELYLRRTEINANFDLNKSVAKKLKVLCILDTFINSFNLEAILRTHPSLQSVNCDQNIRQTLDSMILTTNQTESLTCLHFNKDNRFDKTN